MLFSYWRVSHRVCNDVELRKRIEREFGKNKVDSSASAVFECISIRDYLTICHLDVGGAANDIDVSILHALMKGTDV